jgi:hypothetical protein
VTGRERRLVTIGAVAAGAMLFYWMVSGPSAGGSKAVSEPVESVERTERRLDTLRKAAAKLPATEEISRKVVAELAQREKGLIQADTAAQAQARLLQILREVARNQKPPLDIRQTELGQPASFGDSYGQVGISITTDCSTAQLVNFIAYLSVQPESIATEEIRFGAGNPKTKTVPVRLTVTAIVPRKLVPERKTTVTF